MNANASIFSARFPTSLAELPSYVSRFDLGILDIHSRGPLSLTDQMTVCCKEDHVWDTTIYHLDDSCLICKIIAIFRKHDQVIKYEHQTFNPVSNSFEFRCSDGHLFVSSLGRANRGCSGCALIKKAFAKYLMRIRLDPDSLVASDHSRLRFHCDTLKHDPNCTCGDDRATINQCQNFVTCDQDFYTTPKMIRNSINTCGHDHVWVERWEVINSVRMFELYYDCKFDDRVAGIDMTGYNKNAKVAFSHLADTCAERSLHDAIIYCAENDIKFVIIAKNVTKGSKLATRIFSELYSLGEFDEGVEKIILRIRNKMRHMAKMHKLFADRIKK